MTTSAARTAAGIGGAAVLAAAITTAILVVGGSTPAGASDLERFASCDAMQAWVDEVNASSAGAPTAAAAEERATAEGEGDASAGGQAADAGAGGDTSGGDTGGTNTVVEGVDEIDVVERLDGGRALVARNGTLSLVELDGLRVVASAGGLPYDARISVGGEVVWVAGTNAEGTGVVVRRLTLADGSLADDGEWTTPGWLLDARRTGDRLHVVAVDQPFVAGAIPFEDGPVPCEDVWRPVAGADTAAATLLATLPAEGPLAPTAAAEVVGAGAGFHVTATAAYVTTQTWDASPVTGVHRFDLATLSPTGSGSVPGIVPGPFGLSEHEGHLRVATSIQPSGVVGIAEIDGDVAVDIAPAPLAQGAGPLAEVFVLDLDGSLDVVGSTGRFGHDGETIHGVRFVGDTGYVVTFLQTDPFWVLDLADPASPTVVGELEIPGFSGYLHPAGDGRVVGFGPDGAGRTAARLFDVANPAAPAVVDEIVLGHESTVTWDHHAYVALDDGGFAVPVTDWPEYVGDRCVEPGPAPVPLPEPVPVPEPGPDPRPVDPGIGDGSGGGAPGDPGQSCEPIFEGGSTGVAVLRVDDGRLVLADERSVASDGSFVAERVLPVPDGGWVLVGWDRLVDTDGGQLVLPA